MEVIEKIDETLAHYTACRDLCEKVMFVLRRFEGKVINVRVKEALREALPEWTVYLEHSPYSGIRLNIWKGVGVITYGNQFSLTLAKKSETYARINACKMQTELNPWYFSISDSMLSARIELETLKLQASDFVSKWNIALCALKAISYQVTVFPISTLFSVGYIGKMPESEEVDTE
jgi:hypothetical protein